MTPKRWIAGWMPIVLGLVACGLGAPAAEMPAAAAAGATFVYDFGFPHVIQALEPSGECFLSYEELEPAAGPGSRCGRG